MFASANAGNREYGGISYSFFREVITIGDIRLGLYSDYFTAISSDRDNIIFFLIIQLTTYF